MVTREEFEQFIAEVESFRDMFMEELARMRAEIEKLNETVNDLIKETKANVNKKIG
jgi:BMFP domain-containing protein YqiC